MARTIKQKTFSPDPQIISKLEEMEMKIHEGIVKYYETGMWLQKICNEKMYLHRDCKSFAEYCQKTFDFGRAYGYRLIAYCNVWNQLHDEDKDKIPERVIRTLGTVKDPEARQRIWNSVRKTSQAKLPSSKEVELEVREWSLKQHQEKAGFDPKDETFIFCRALNCKIKSAEIEKEIIEKSGNKYRSLLLAIKELLNNHTLDPEKHNIKLLKTTLLKLQKQQVELLLPEKSSVKKEAK